MEAEERTPASFGFFERLSMVPGMQMGRITSDRDTWVTSVQWQDVEATVLCSTDIRPVTFDSKGKPEFGSYLIVDVGYGHHIKGQSDDDCVSYVRCWLTARSLRGKSSTKSAPWIPDSTPLTSELGLDDVSPELRDPLRNVMIWAGLKPSNLKALDRALICVEQQDVAVKVGIESTQLYVIADEAAGPLVVYGSTSSAQASSILGYLDGLSDVSE